MALQKICYGSRKKRSLVIEPGLVTINIRNAHLDQNSADVLVFQLHRSVGPVVQLLHQGTAMLGLVVFLAFKLKTEHAEIIRNGCFDFGIRPVARQLGSSTVDDGIV